MSVEIIFVRGVLRLQFVDVLPEQRAVEDVNAAIDLANGPLGRRCGFLFDNRCDVAGSISNDTPVSGRFGNLGRDDMTAARAFLLQSDQRFQSFRLQEGAVAVQDQKIPGRDAIKSLQHKTACPVPFCSSW